MSGTTYTFRVRALNSSGSLFSHYNTGKGIVFVAAPKLTSVSKVSTGIKISWGKVTGASKYRVYYKEPGGSFSKLADTYFYEYVWADAKKGVRYTFTVRCLDESGKVISIYDKDGLSITR